MNWKEIMLLPLHLLLLSVLPPSSEFSHMASSVLRPSSMSPVTPPASLLCKWNALSSPLSTMARTSLSYLIACMDIDQVRRIPRKKSVSLLGLTTYSMSAATTEEGVCKIVTNSTTKV
jgi:hypothetical protein